MEETIQVGYKPLFGGRAYHKYIIYTDSSGNEHVAHALPSTKYSPTATIETHVGNAAGQFDPGEWEGARRSDRKEPIDAGDDLSGAWNKIKEKMASIDGQSFKYKPFDQNSNSVADTALDHAGLPLPVYDDPGERWSPGSDIILPDENVFPVWPHGMPPIPFPLPFFPTFFSPPISPLVLDLDGGGVELVTLAASRALFDLDTDSFAQHTGWVASDDALLAIDRNGNGRIDNIGEVFGNGTTDGFSELRALDSNADGRIDANDAGFGELLLWRDLNGNGWSEAAELQSLANGGVRSIDLSAVTSTQTIAGHRISHTGSFTHTDGTTGTIVDAWFENNRHISAYVPADGFTLHADVSALPELKGYGVVAPLSVAMTLDAGLRQRVTNLMLSSDSLATSDFRDRVIEIVLDWTGADTVDPHSRGRNIDARHLAAMEALAGTGFVQNSWSDPRPVAAAALEAGFQDFVDMTTVRLLAQSAVSSFLIDRSALTTTDTLTSVDAHPFAGVGALRYNPGTNELSGSLETLLQVYVRSHAEGSTPPLNIDDTIALLAMLRVDFGDNVTAYRAAVQAAFVAAGFEEAVATGYAARTGEPGLRVTNGTAGDDTIRGFAVDDAIAGGNGADVLHGLDGDDTLEGGPGDDTLHGGDDDDTLDGGAGDDTLHGGDDDDTLDGGAGDDTLHGGDDDDTLHGGPGEDTLAGADGSDTYVFSRGDGADTVEDNGSGDTDRLAIRGYTPAQVTVIWVADVRDDVVLTFTGTEDRITIRNTLAGTRQDMIEEVVFDDGTVWTWADLRTQVMPAMKATGGAVVVHGIATRDATRTPTGMRWGTVVTLHDHTLDYRETGVRGRDGVVGPAGAAERRPDWSSRT